MNDKPFRLVGRACARARHAPLGIHSVLATIALLCSALVISAPALRSQGSSGKIRHFRNQTVLISPQAHLAATPHAIFMSDTETVPIPGGIDIPPLIHIFAPGPTQLGFQGLDVEPNGITNFKGFAAMGYPAGTASGSDGTSFTMMNDMRVFRGEYVAADGSHHHGTFVFI
jgi:hypothetical protein